VEKSTNRCATATRGRCRRRHKTKTLFERKSKSPKPSSGDCVNRLAQPSSLGMEARSTIRWQHRLKREHPTCTERTKSLNKECGWKGGDSGDSAGEKPCSTKSEEPLDSDRPSHGRRLHSLRIGQPGVTVAYKKDGTRLLQRLIGSTQYKVLGVNGREYPGKVFFGRFRTVFLLFRCQKMLL
jgi:hypothetical protein